MLPNGTVQRMMLVALVATLIVMATVFLWQPSGTNVAAERSSASARVERAEQERQAAAVRAEAVAARAAVARVAAEPPVARAESLRARVRVVAPGLLQVDSAIAGIMRVPPVVTDRLQSDSVAISALTVALTWDTRAAAAQEARLAAEAKAREATTFKIAQLEREKTPRCGRRCGFVLGVVSVVALGIAAEQAHRLLHP